MTNSYSDRLVRLVKSFFCAVKAFIFWLSDGTFCHPGLPEPIQHAGVAVDENGYPVRYPAPAVQINEMSTDRGLGSLLDANSPAVEHPERGGHKKVEHRGNEVEVHGGRFFHGLLVAKVGLTAFFKANGERLISLARMRELLPELADLNDHRLYNALKTLCRLELLKQVGKGRRRGQHIGEACIFAVMAEDPGYLIRTIEVDYFGRYGALQSNELTQIILRAKAASPPRQGGFEYQSPAIDSFGAAVVHAGGGLRQALMNPPERTYTSFEPGDGSITTVKENGDGSYSKLSGGHI